MTRRRFVVVLSSFLVLAGTAVPRAQEAPPVRLSSVEMERFLATAPVVSHRPLSKGITKPVRLTLSDGRLTHDAAFSSVRERAPEMRFRGGRVERNFVDSYEYNVAAYRLARLLELDAMMPVAVEREWNGRKGAVTWWVDASWDEGDRRKLGLKPPDVMAWTDQLARMRIFEHLVADTDRNLGNILIDDGWGLWMIDFTRAFRLTRQLQPTPPITRCDRHLLTRLRTLTHQEVAAATRPFLGPPEVAALMARRDAIVAAVDRLVAERGERRVLY